MRARVVARRGARSSRRKLVWAETDTDITVGAIGHAVNLDLLAAFRVMAGADSVGATVMRTHFKLWVTSAVAAGDGFATGIVVTGVNQISGGFVVSGPPNLIDPTMYPYEEWMWKNRHGAHPTYGERTSNNFVEYDVRAKRKLDELQMTQVFSITNTGAVAALSVAVWSRTLLALP